MVGKSTKHIRGSNSQKRELMRYCKKAVTSRLDRSLDTTVEILQSANLHCSVWSSMSPAKARTYLAGSELLDPQYEEFPADISPEDYKHYFEPIALTDDSGGPAGWLKPYVPRSAKQPSRQIQEPTDVEPVSAYPRTPADLPVDRASVI